MSSKRGRPVGSDLSKSPEVTHLHKEISTCISTVKRMSLRNGVLPSIQEITTEVKEVLKDKDKVHIDQLHKYLVQKNEDRMITIEFNRDELKNSMMSLKMTPAQVEMDKTLDTLNLEEIDQMKSFYCYQIQKIQFLKQTSVKLNSTITNERFICQVFDQIQDEKEEKLRRLPGDSQGDFDINLFDDIDNDDLTENN